jgi:hypothetical protein
MKIYKPQVGETIEVNWRPVFSTDEGFNPQEAVVIDLLDVQFIAEVQVDGEPLTYRFYTDIGNSWRFKE